MFYEQKSHERNSPCIFMNIFCHQKFSERTLRLPTLLSVSVSTNGPIQSSLAQQTHGMKHHWSFRALPRCGTRRKSQIKAPVLENLKRLYYIHKMACCLTTVFFCICNILYVDYYRFGFFSGKRTAGGKPLLNLHDFHGEPVFRQGPKHSIYDVIM